MIPSKKQVINKLKNKENIVAEVEQSTTQTSYEDTTLKNNGSIGRE
jgi:hypothetical protein